MKNFPTLSTLLAVILLGSVTFLSWEKSLNFDLWQDDNALIFKLQHLEEQAGVFGPGAFGLGAYRYIAVPYIPLYKLFALDIKAFYLFALTFYFLASISIYFFTKFITKNTLIGLLASLVFASGFVGSDGILRLFNSIQTSYSLIFSLITFGLIYLYSNNKKVWVYLASLVMFYFTIETAYVRTQYLIFPTATLLFLFTLNFNKVRSVVLSFVYASPFFSIYYLQFLVNPDQRSSLVGEYLKNLGGGKVEYLHSFLATTGNLILPTRISNFLFEFLGTFTQDFYNRSVLAEAFFLALFLGLVYTLARQKLKLKIFFSCLLVFWLIINLSFFWDTAKYLNNPSDLVARNNLANFLGGSLIILSTVYIFTIKNVNVLKSVIFLLSWILFNILSFSIYLPQVPLDTQNRYLVHSFAPLSILIPLLFWQKSKLLAIAVCLAIITTNINLSRNYQEEFLTQKSVPSRNFYSSLKKSLPDIKRGSVIWFDVAQDPISQQQFRDFFSVASMPDSTAIAVRYGIDRDDFVMTQDFAEFVKTSKNTRNTFSFFYNSEGLADTTQSMRNNLFGPKKESPDSPITPLAISFRAKAKVKENSQTSCPQPDLTADTKNKIFEFLLSERDFYKNTKLDTSSQEKGFPRNLLLDQNENSVWRGGRGFWLENQKEEIVIELGNVKTISQFTWTNGYANSTPTVYSIEVSLDGKVWQVVKQTESSDFISNSQTVRDSFPESKARFIKMKITDTFDHDSPAIREVSISKNEFSQFNSDLVAAVKENPFVCTKNHKDLALVRNYLLKAGIETLINIKTNKSSQPSRVSFSIIPDGEWRNYQITANPGGTKIESIEVSANDKNYKLEVNSIKLRHLTFDQLREFNPK